MRKSALGIDIGGSSTKLGLVNPDGTVTAPRRLHFDARQGFAAFADALAGSAGEILGETGARGAAIGIAIPGYTDPQTGICVDGTDNVPVLSGQSLPEALARRLGLPVTVSNDGVAAAVGEHSFGAGRGLDRFVMLTIGTGIGGGLIVDGRPLLGRRGEPPEFGAMILDAAGPVNYSGLPGTLEALASVSGLSRAYGSQDVLAAERIFERAAKGEDGAREAVDNVCGRLAQALGTLISVLNLQACILGGGVSNAGPALSQRVAAHLPRYTWPLLLARCELRLAALRNQAGIVGAAVLAERHTG